VTFHELYEALDGLIKSIGPGAKVSPDALHRSRVSRAPIGRGEFTNRSHARSHGPIGRKLDHSAVHLAQVYLTNCDRAPAAPLLSIIDGGQRARCCPGTAQEGEVPFCATGPIGWG
jgi:hypothetical protein